MRILQVITPSKIAGAERSTTSLCEHLARAGHQVIVACKRHHPLLAVMQEAGLDARGLPISGKANLLAPFRLAQLARAEQVEVINTQLSTAALWGALAGRLAGIPTVATVRALNTKTVYTLADRVIAVSHAVKAHLVAQGMAAERIDVVYNGIDPGRYRHTVSREQARGQWGLSETAVVFAVVAHLTTKKGHAVFLDAAARLRKEVGEHQYLFAGEGPERASLERQAGRLGLGEQVHFLGFQADVLPVYAAADVVVLPSIAGEGLPRALLEGGLLHRPVIASNISGAPEIVEEGVSGLMVKPGDPEALAHVMRRLGSDPDLRTRFGAAAAARVSHLFTISGMVMGTLATYQRVLPKQLKV